MASSGDRRERIEAALRERLSARHVELVDESHLHAGHAGAASGGGHFRALVVSEAFEGRSQLERQRLVYAALAREMGSEIHALALRTLAPSEWESITPGARATPRGPG
jgi:BolA protein